MFFTLSIVFTVFKFSLIYPSFRIEVLAFQKPIVSFENKLLEKIIMFPLLTLTVANAFFKLSLISLTISTELLAFKKSKMLFGNNKEETISKW